MKYPIDINLVRATVKKRNPEADKRDIGTLLSVCGSYKMAGAAILSAKAALRSGVGLLKLALPDSIYPIVAPVVPESVFVTYKDEQLAKVDFHKISQYATACLIGCGLSVTSGTKNFVRRAVAECEVPIILDADALNIIAETPEVLLDKKADVIITPHIREFSRLSGLSIEAIKADREEAALSFAEKYGVIVVLKGHKTVVAAPNGEVRYNEALGNAGMATGGSGDVLAGVVAALASQGFDLLSSACSGVYLHALAGDIAKQKYGEISMLPSDIVECLPEAFKKIFP